LKRIGIDMDGTVADYMAGAVPLLAEHYGLTPDFSIEAYSIEEVFGLTKDTRPLNMRQNLYVDQHLFAKLPILDQGNQQLTSELMSQLGPDLKVYFVTARDNHPVVMEDSREWLKLNTDHFDDAFHVQDKAGFCKLAGIQVMIEDEVRQITELLHAGIDVIMRDQPWNQHLPADPRGLEDNKGRLTRVHSWTEMVEVAKEYYA
jgi:5'(3')-deoxyribonucleotidase